MSIQSDIEILSIHAMETYAARNHISGEKAIEIFHRCHVFESIIIQHEYLHQVSFEEVMEYVEQIISENSRKLTVFHGTTKKFDQIDLSKSHNRRDFGMGFYTTVLEEQSREWAYRLSLREKVSKYFVYQFTFEESKALKIKRFNGLKKEWLEFIKKNRSQGGLSHSYDVVIGPVADDNTMETIQLYMSGILSENEAISRLRYNKVNNKISFHTEKALNHLNFVKRYEYG